MSAQPKKRKVDIVVISDVHLGTYGCHAKELLAYLRSVRPKTIILNGDFIDIWQFSKRYWPKPHMKVVRHLTNLMSKKVKIYYITGNHDEMLRKFSGFALGSLRIVDKLVLELPGDKKAWFFHGDVFDITMKHSRWLARCGAVGYDLLILLNRGINLFSERILKRGKVSLSKRIKNSVKSAIRFIDDFEQTAADIAIDNKYDFVVCGHIHQPQMRVIENSKGSVVYLNSGDWIENLTALECTNGEWTLYKYNDLDFSHETETSEDVEKSPKELYASLLQNFAQVNLS